MNANKPIRALIADDHAVVREGLAALFAQEKRIAVVGLARDGAEAVALYRDLRPDILLIDIRMPNMGGIEAIETIRREFRKARILALSCSDTEEEIYRALSAGALSYLLKDADRTELMRSIEAVAAGTACISPEIASKLVQRVKERSLTAREHQILEHMTLGKSNQEIGAALVIAEGTVKSHINSILRKMGVSDRTQAVTSAMKRGLVFLD